MVDDKTSELWREFNPEIKNVSNRIGAHRISLQVYPDHYFKKFDPRLTFEKWAAVEVTDSSNLPPKLESLVIPSGLFAVFHFKGSSGDAPKLFQNIYGVWLPNSEYEVDQRPHFEILGEKYRNNDPESEEDIWIPIRPKKNNT